MIVQLCVGDIIFDATNKILCREFARLIQDKFEMSMIGQLNFFLDSRSNNQMKRFSSTKASTLRKC